MHDPSTIITNILKHESKRTTYKFALVRAINDLALQYPHHPLIPSPVAIPLWMLARLWFAYFWPFVDPAMPIRQGHDQTDMAFREDLTYFRQQWQLANGEDSSAEGYYVTHVMATSRHTQHCPLELEELYQTCLRKLIKSLHQPIRFAGTGEYNLFQKPMTLAECPHATPLPQTQPQDLCLVVPFDLWQTFQQLSLHIEEVCLDQWCAFTHALHQPHHSVHLSTIHALLTSRPDERRMVIWERNQIDRLLLQGFTFHCPWTRKLITVNTPYDLDPIVPITLYPLVELWNLMPVDPIFNSQTKQDRLPSPLSLERAKPVLVETYQHYWSSNVLKSGLKHDAERRFGNLDTYRFPTQLHHYTQDFILQLATHRHLAQF